MDLDFVSVHKNAKRELGQYPAILTSRLVNNIYINHKNYNFLAFDWFEKGLFSINSLAKLLSDSLLLDSLLLDSLLSDSSKSQSHSKM